jgi:hypothetical protein
VLAAIDKEKAKQLRSRRLRQVLMRVKAQEAVNRSAADGALAQEVAWRKAHRAASGDEALLLVACEKGDVVAAETNLLPRERFGDDRPITTKEFQ